MEQDLKSSKGSKNKVYNWLSTLKTIIIPVTKKEKMKRMKQIKDITLFVSAITLLIVFQKKIEKLITVNPEEVQRLSQQINN